MQEKNRTANVYVPDLTARRSRGPSPILQGHRGYSGGMRTPPGHSSSGGLPDYWLKSG